MIGGAAEGNCLRPVSGGGHGGTFTISQYRATYPAAVADDRHEDDRVMESKKANYGGLQRFLIDPPPPYASAQVLERFLEDAKRWPKKMLDDAHVQRVLAETRAALQWARKNPTKDANAAKEDAGEKENRLKDSGLFQSKRESQ